MEKKSNQSQIKESDQQKQQASNTANSSRIENNQSTELPTKDEAELSQCPHLSKDRTKSLLRELLYRVEFIKQAIEQVKKEGFLSLYNGLISSIWIAVFQNGTYFCMSKFFNILSEKYKFQKNIKNDLLISLFSAVITSYVINPICVVNARMSLGAEQVFYY